MNYTRRRVEQFQNEDRSDYVYIAERFDGSICVAELCAGELDIVSFDSLAQLKELIARLEATEPKEE